MSLVATTHPEQRLSAFRRVRAALTIGLLWSAAWAVCGAALGAWRVLFGHPQLADPSRYLGRFMGVAGTVLGIYGLLAGAAFALALSRTERSREVLGLSLRRAVGWGALSGAAAGLITIPFLGFLPPVPVIAVVSAILATVGSLSAFGTVRIAQHGKAPTTELGR
jgi:hypothetical protein